MPEAPDVPEVPDVTEVPDVPAVPVAYDRDDNPLLWKEHMWRAFDRWQNYQPEEPLQYRVTSPGTLEGLRSRLSFFAQVPSLMTLSGRVVAEYELHRNELLPETLMEFIIKTVLRISPGLIETRKGKIQLRIGRKLCQGKIQLMAHCWIVSSW